MTEYRSESYLTSTWLSLSSNSLTILQNVLISPLRGDLEKSFSHKVEERFTFSLKKVIGRQCWALRDREGGGMCGQSLQSSHGFNPDFSASSMAFGLFLAFCFFIWK